jgi:hypothetical protein
VRPCHSPLTCGEGVIASRASIAEIVHALEAACPGQSFTGARELEAGFGTAPGLPYGAIGYRRLEGQPCRPDTATAATSRDLGRFMAALHQLDTRGFPAMPDEHAIWRAWRWLRDDTAEILRRMLSTSRTSAWAAGGKRSCPIVPCGSSGRPFGTATSGTATS